MISDYRLKFVKLFNTRSENRYDGFLYNISDSDLKELEILSFDFRKKTADLIEKDKDLGYQKAKTEIIECFENYDYYKTPLFADLKTLYERGFSDYDSIVANPKELINGYTDHIAYLLELLADYFPKVLEKANFKGLVKEFLPGHHRYYKHSNNTDVKLNQTSFDSNLSDKQLEKLHSVLCNNFIHKDTPNDLFSGIFNKLNVTELKGEKVQWIDISMKGKKPNIKTLYELLFLLKERGFLTEPNFDTSNKNKDNLYKKIDNCFFPFENIGKKNPDSYTFKPQENTNRKKELKLLIESL